MILEHAPRRAGVEYDQPRPAGVGQIGVASVEPHVVHQTLAGRDRAQVVDPRYLRRGKRDPDQLRTAREGGGAEPRRAGVDDPERAILPDPQRVHRHERRARIVAGAPPVPRGVGKRDDGIVSPDLADLRRRGAALPLERRERPTVARRGDPIDDQWHPKRRDDGRRSRRAAARLGRTELDHCEPAGHAHGQKRQERRFQRPPPLLGSVPRRWHLSCLRSRGWRRRTR